MSMNKERLMELAAALETDALPDNIGFNMDYYLYIRDSEDDKDIPTHTDSPCGTTACIAGLAVAMYGKVPVASYWKEGADILSLNTDQACRLFEPTNVADYSKITPKHAAAVIRNLVDTGTVDWTVGADD